MTSSPITSWQIDGKTVEQWQILFSWAPKSLKMVIAAKKLKDTCSLEEKQWQENIDSIFKSRDITLLTKVLLVKKKFFFSNSNVLMWEVDHKESSALKNWCFWTVVLEKTLESPLNWKEIKPVNPKGNQLWIFIGRTGAEAEAPILWPPDVKSWLIWKDPDAGKDWRQEKGTKEDEMIIWHHWFDGHEFE